MKRFILLLLLASCAPTRTVQLTFGESGEGLDGFMCRDQNDALLLKRAHEDGAASLVFDFIELKGVPGCRTGQLVSWCRTHECKPRTETRGCVPVNFAAPEETRPKLREQLRESMRAVRGAEAIADAPNEFVLVRVVGTTQSCDEVLADAAKPFEPQQLLGCAYSCPVSLDDVTDESVYLGFDGFVDNCSQGVLICSSPSLTWQTEGP